MSAITSSPPPINLVDAFEDLSLTENKPSIQSTLRELFGEYVDNHEHHDLKVQLSDLLIEWIERTKPSPLNIAKTIHNLAHVAAGWNAPSLFSGIADSQKVKFITRYLVGILVRDEDHKIHHSDNLYIIKTLFQLMKTDPVNPRAFNGKTPNWTEELHGIEEVFFIRLATREKVKQQVQDVLFPHYTREGASQKSLYLAISVSPLLKLSQIKILYSKLSPSTTCPMRKLFFQVVNSKSFCPLLRARLFNT